MKIHPIAPPEVWDSVAERCPAATFFHTRAWAELFEKTYPRYFRSAARAFEFGPDDWAVLPMMETGNDCKGMFKSFASNVPGVYGGPISSKPLTPEKLRAMEAALRPARSGQVDVFGNPYSDPIPFSSKWKTEEGFTHVIDLEEFSSPEQIAKSYRSDVRRQIDKGAQLGLSHRLAETEADVRAYYAAYLDSVNRWKDLTTSFYKLELFQNLFAMRSPRVQLWLVARDEKVLGGMVTLAHGRHKVYWHGAYLSESFDVFASKYLTHRLILDAKAGGYKHFDFNPSGGHKGTIQFKENFGARKKSFTSARYDHNFLYKAIVRVRSLFTGESLARDVSPLAPKSSS